MKIAAASPVYNEEGFIPGLVKNIEPYVEEHLILVSKKPYYREYDEQDRTAEVANDLGCTVIEGSWDQEHIQRNTGNVLLKNYDWIIWMDADMRFTEKNINSLIDRMNCTEADALMVNHIAYWKDHNHVLDDDFSPVVAVRPQVRYRHINCPELGFKLEFVKESKVHHFCWSKPKDILKKVLTFGHANEFDGERWYKDYYIGCDGDFAVMPQGNKKRIMKGFLPDEIREFI